MRHLASSIAVVALAGSMTAMPAGAQTKLHGAPLAVPGPASVVVANRLPAEGEPAVVSVRDADTEAEIVIDGRAMDDPAAPQVGMARTDFGPEIGIGVLPEDGAPLTARPDFPLPVKSRMRMDDAESGRPMEVLNDNEFDPSQHGYTLMAPGEVEVRPGMLRPAPTDRDVVDIVETN